MNNLWEYKAQNLLALKAMIRTNGNIKYVDNIAEPLALDKNGDKIGSLFTPCIWPQDGYLSAKCFTEYATVIAAGQIPKDAHAFHKDCVCGIYGCLDFKSLYAEVAPILMIIPLSKQWEG